MGRIPYCNNVIWNPEEDEKLVQFINKNGHTSSCSLSKLAVAPHLMSNQEMHH
ncbi:hypothetical protein P3S67_015875 [Capsicum chacoense]